MKQCPRCGYSPSGKVRSDPQNRYYWGVVVQILSEDLGYTRQEIHEILKREHLKQVLTIKNKRTGEMGFIENTRSTTELDTKEFEEFLSTVRIWASEKLGIWVPEPNEVLEDKK